MSTYPTSLPGGTWTLGDLTVTRFGYGAMQLAGPGVMGPPADHDGALAVLREAAGLGITHIDTSDAYGPHVTNQLIREALHPYPESLHIVTKVGATRDQQGGWPPARDPESLRRSVNENLKNLGLDPLRPVRTFEADPGCGAPRRSNLSDHLDAALADIDQRGRRLPIDLALPPTKPGLVIRWRVTLRLATVCHGLGGRNALGETLAIMRHGWLPPVAPNGARVLSRTKPE